MERIAKKNQSYLQVRSAKLPRFTVKEMVDGGWAVLEVVHLFETEQEAEKRVRELIELVKGEQT